MGTYKGNVGNLMQHWTLCDLLIVAGKHTSGLNFIDTHAMAPIARTRTGTDVMFDRVRAGLQARHRSAYEQAWHRLAPNDGYPNSAAFVKAVWEGDFSLLLCETDSTTAKEIVYWLKGVSEFTRCKSAELFPDDWRKRFAEGIAGASEVGLRDRPLTLVSFDPYMYNRRIGAKTQNKGNLYPEDVELALDALGRVKGGIIIQLSTYSTNDNNPQGAVISSVNSIMVARAFTLSGVVRVDNKMMSLIYARNVSWADELANLPDRFHKWHAGIPVS